MKLLFSILCLLILSVTGFAQDYPKSEFFAGYSYLRTPSETVTFTGGSFSQDSGNLHGYNAMAIYNFNRTIGIVGDSSGHFGTINYFARSGLTTTRIRVKSIFNSFLGGPQFHLRGDKTTLFVRSLAGITLATQSDRSGNTDTGTAFTAAFGGGVDRSLSDRISIRLFQADYFLTRFGNNGTVGSSTQSNLRVSTGIIIKSKTK